MDSKGLRPLCSSEKALVRPRGALVQRLSQRSPVLARIGEPCTAATFSNWLAAAWEAHGLGLQADPEGTSLLVQVLLKGELSGAARAVPPPELGMGTLLAGGWGVLSCP